MFAVNIDFAAIQSE